MFDPDGNPVCNDKGVPLSEPNDALVFPATERLLEAVRLAFKMVPFDPETGEGALEPDCFKALEDFTAFLNEQKKNIG